MAARKTPQRLRTQGKVWGPRRVELGVSLNELARLTGVQKADLSRMEAGRMNPSWEEYRAVTAVLDERAASMAAVGATIPVEPAAAAT